MLHLTATDTIRPISPDEAGTCLIYNDPTNGRTFTGHLLYTTHPADPSPVLEMAERIGWTTADTADPHEVQADAACALYDAHGTTLAVEPSDTPAIWTDPAGQLVWPPILHLEGWCPI